MSIRRGLPVLLIAVLSQVGALAALEMPASAATEWTTPRHIPGTNGQANPVSATSKDGTSVVVWTEGTGVGTQNAVHARVRLAGHITWRDVPVQLKGSYLQSLVLVPTASGDVWIAYQRNTGSGFPEVFVSKLDTSARSWSSPVRVFDQPDYGHAAPRIGRARDGTLVVSAYAPPKVPPSGTPGYRVVVATKAPGGSWHSRFLSPRDDQAASHDLAVNADGDIVVSFVQGNDLSEMRVRASTKRHGAHAAWRTRTLSVAGDAQQTAAAIGDDGIAAVVWAATSSSPHTIRMSTRDVDLSLDPWVGRDVTADTAGTTDPDVVVTASGRVTVVWRRNVIGEATLWGRTLAHETLGDAVRLSPTGQSAVLDALVLRPDGKAAMLYQVFASSSSLGLRFRTLRNGVPSSVTRLTGDAATDGDANSAAMGIDGHSHATVIYTRGSYPDTEFAWLGQVPAAP